MSLLTVPLTHNLSAAIEMLVERGVAGSKADLARRALEKYISDLAVETVLAAQKEVRAGQVLRGDLDTLAKQI